MYVPWLFPKESSIVRFCARLCVGWRHGRLPGLERCAAAPLPRQRTSASHPDAPHAPNPVPHAPTPPTAARAEEIDLLFYERSKVAEALRDRETRKAVRLQSAHRGRALRLEVAEWNAMALVIERCTRGHLGRQQARRLRIERDTRRQRSFFDALATTVQKRFRAYHARKYRHNFYARQAYVASVLRKGDMVREDLRSRMDEQVRDALETQETQARERVNTLSKKLHHLRSTATCAGIYNSAYHVGHHPTAFGVPVEDLTLALAPTPTPTIAPTPALAPTLALTLTPYPPPGTCRGAPATGHPPRDQGRARAPAAQHRAAAAAGPHLPAQHWSTSSTLTPP